MGRGAPSYFPDDELLCLLVAEALIQKGMTLARLEYHSDAIAAFDAVVRRYGDAVESPLREQLAFPFNCVGPLFRLEGQRTQSLPPSDEVNRLLRQQVADALVCSGIWELREAKRCIQKDAGRVAAAFLGSAEARMDAAVKLGPDNLIALGHAGYIAFLWGRRDEARSLLAESLRRGGEKMRAARLATANIHPLPQDEDFRALLHELSRG
ncbi:hypothetical protein ACN28S_55970 [Cystobacter fuscus]